MHDDGHHPDNALPRLYDRVEVRISGDIVRLDEDGLLLRVGELDSADRLRIPPGLAVHDAVEVEVLSRVYGHGRLYFDKDYRVGYWSDADRLFHAMNNAQYARGRFIPVSEIEEKRL